MTSQPNEISRACHRPHRGVHPRRVAPAHQVKTATFMGLPSESEAPLLAPHAALHEAARARTRRVEIMFGKREDIGRDDLERVVSGKHRRSVSVAEGQQLYLPVVFWRHACPEPGTRINRLNGSYHEYHPLKPLD